jgi:uracil-DNA glycosylase
LNIFNFPDTWIEPLGKGFCQDFLDEIDSKFSKLNTGNANIFPPINSVFRALELVHFKEAKILILGQDPYHGLGQANGLSFSVNKKIAIPPSLKNIFLELKNDLNIPISSHGDLTSWAKQKILLLNSILTVEQGRPNSHQELGWEELTNKIISQLSLRGNMIFVLWGNIAQKKFHLIDNRENTILCAPHPSPLSAYR